LGISTGHVVVGLDGIEGRAGHRLQTFELGTAVRGKLNPDRWAGVTERGKRGERVAHHRLDVERASGLIEGPQRFGAISVERGQVSQRRVWEIARRETGLIEGAQERERVEARLFKPPA